MDFGEAARRYTELQVQRQNGSLSDQQYRTLIDQLRVTDERGIWWQPDPGGTGWIFWNGTQWQPGTPPLPVQTSPSPYIPAVQSDPTTPITHDKKLMDTGTFREIARTTAWNKRPQKWWDLFAILVGVVSAIIWLLYSGAPKTSEGIDFISVFLMIGIPFVLVFYRAKIDTYLVGLQPHRHRFSKIVLIGMGLAAPYLTAFILFNVLGIKNYPLMHWNLILGTAVSYAIMREPVLAPGYQPTRGPNLKVPLLLLLIGSLLIRIVAADHCLSDPLNAQDCERSSGFAEGMSGTPASALSAGANGQEIVRSVTMGPNYSLPSAPGTVPGATSSVTSTLPATATPEQIAHWFLFNQEYLQGNWKISRDSTGTATGVYLDPTELNRSGATMPLTTTYIPLSELQTDPLISTPVDETMQQQTASRAAQLLTTEDVRTLANSARFNALRDPEKRILIQHIVDSLDKAQGLPSTPATFSSTIPYAAQYNHPTDTIEIKTNIWSYNDRTELLKIIAHEMKHKGQTHNAGLGTSLAVMQDNNADYITPTNDPSRYATQLKERDSVHFSNVFKNAIRARRQQDKSVASTPTTSGGP